jgi:hypothetical protein
MDLLDLDGQGLYFEQPLAADVQALIAESSEHYRTPLADATASGDIEPVPVDPAEWALVRAYLREPEHLSVIVALYRFFYYRHRYPDALRMADRAVVLSCRQLGLGEDWRRLDQADLHAAAQRSMTMTRFLLLALKGAGWLLLRQEQPEAAAERLTPVVAFDSEDRLGARDLLDWAEKASLRARLKEAGANVHLLDDS